MGKSLNSKISSNSSSISSLSSRVSTNESNISNIQSEVNILNSNLSTSNGKLKVYSGTIYLNGGALGVVYHHQKADGAEWYTTPICLIECMQEDAYFDVSVIGGTKTFHYIKNNTSITLGIRYIIIGIVKD